MSVVYLVKDWKIDKLWAMKVLSGDMLVNESEFHLLKRLDHFGLPRVVDWFYINQRVAYIMDYIEGETLDTVLKNQHVLSSESVKCIAIQLCDILHYLHTQQPPIIYRDMKPSNIMWLKNGKVKLIDLSISRTYKLTQCSDTQILGTKGYSPPEQYGSLQTDERSDVYALGMTLHHLLTGCDPRQIGYIYQSAKRFNKRIDRRLSDVIDKCTQIDPKKRYHNCLNIKRDMTQKWRISYKKIGIGVLSISIVYGLVFSYYYNQLVSNERQYDELLWQKNPTEVGGNYIQAIHLMPHRIEAYKKLLSVITEHDFEKGKQQLLALYRLYQHRLDSKHRDVQQFYYEFSRQLLAYMTLNQHDFYYQLQQVNYFLEPLVKQQTKLTMVQHYYFFCQLYMTYMPTQLNVDDMSAESWIEVITRVDAVLKDGEIFDQLLISQLFLNLVFRQKENIDANNMTEKVSIVLHTIESKISQSVVTQQISKQLKQSILQSVDHIIHALK